MGDTVEVDAEERVGVKRRLLNLKGSSRVKRRKVPKSAVEAANLDVGLVGDTVVTSVCVVDVADPRIAELSVPLAITKAEFILLTSKLYNLEVVRGTAKLEHLKFSK